MEEVLEKISRKITTEMNEELDKPFNAEEIITILSQMCLTVVPRPDGFPAAFFQKHFKSVSKWVLTTYLNIFNEGDNIAPLNHTYIALIHKVEKPRQVIEFRTISLCNVIYKIITKTIVNRLKHMLQNIISQTQSAFIPGRLIKDNVVIGYECLHKIRLNKGEKGVGSFKAWYK